MSSSTNLDSIRVDLPMLESKFCSFPAIFLLFQWMVLGGWMGETKSKLTQSQVELEAWAELGKIQNHQINKPSATNILTTKPSTHQTIKPAKHQTSKTANQQTIKPSNYGFVYGPKVFISKWSIYKNLSIGES